MISVTAPINSLSFGNVSFNILKEIYLATGGADCPIFPIGKVDLSPFEVTEDFKNWLDLNIDKALLSHKRDNKNLKIWHIQGLLESVSEKPSSLTFHETSSLTPEEANVLSQQNKVFVTSKYSKSIFERYGVNTIYAPLGFDNTHFFKTDKKYLGDSVITFGLYGKLEERKNTLRILKAWGRKFGNKKEYSLNCLIYNPFSSTSEQSAQILSCFERNEKPFNVNILPFQSTNKDYNDCLNAADIDLTGLSSCEGFNLPAFQSTCLGKWTIYLNAHVHKDYATEDNSILVEPSEEMKLAEDGKFFVKGKKVNQGKWHDFEEEKLEEALEKAVVLAKTPNPEGEKLKEKFTYKKTVEILLNNL